jgi:hypothetical protein
MAPTAEASPAVETGKPPCKLIEVNVNEDAISNLATEFLDPEKLTPLLEEHKSLSPFQVYPLF